MGVVLSYVRVAVNLVCGLLLSTVLLRVLGDTEYGIYQTIAAFANYLVLLEFGMGTVMVRNLSACRATGGDREALQLQVRTLWTMAVCFGCLILVAAVGFCCSIPYVYANSLTAAQILHGQHIFAILAGYVALSFLAQTAEGVLLAMEHYRFSAMESIVRIVLRTGVILTAAFLLKNAMVIAVSELVFSGWRLTITTGYCRRKAGIRLQLGRMDTAILRSAAPLAAAVFLQAIINQANSNVDKFLIGVLLTPETVAQYSVAMYVFGVFLALTTVPVTMYGPKIQQSAAQNGDLLEELTEPARLTALIGGAVLFGFAAVGRPFIRLFYGENYLQAWWIALLLMGAAYFDAIPSAAINGLDAKNKRIGRSAILLASTVLNVALTVVWLQKWGIVGAAAATALSTLLGQVVLGNWYYRKALGISTRKIYRAAFRGVWFWLLLGCGVGALAASWIKSNLAALLVGGCIFVAFLLPILRKWKK